MSPTRAALEAALAADPDDPARHAAYADLLLEEGDPRGEFVRLQLALEDQDLPADRRAAMQRAADELLKRYEAEWFGALRQAIVSVRENYGQNAIVWKRGWIHSIFLPIVDSCTPGALVKSPYAALLRRFETNHSDATYSVLSYESLFAVLSRTCTETLKLVDTRRGDEIVGDLVRSGLTARLRVLDLSRCAISDDGAVALAACPDVPRLKSLTLDGNLISPIGVQALAEVGVRVGPQFWDRGRGDAYV